MKKTIELLANIAILVTGLIIVYTFFHLGIENSPAKPIAIGDSVKGVAVNWTDAEHTLVFAMNKECRFCEKSAPFYKKLLSRAQGNHKIKAVAGLPQDVGPAREYLKGLGLSFGKVVKVDFYSLRIRGTPTVLLIDAKGKVERQWFGLLNPVKESEILALFD